MIIPAKMFIEYGQNIVETVTVEEKNAALKELRMGSYLGTFEEGYLLGLGTYEALMVMGGKI